MRTFRPTNVDANRNTAECRRSPLKIIELLMVACLMPVGPAIFVAFFGSEVRHYLDAENWIPVKAVVIESKLLVHEGDDSDTCRANIAYAYQANGRAYTGSRYVFFDYFGPFCARRQRVVDAHLPGKEITVHVSPRHPEQAVICRGLTREAALPAFACLLWMLFPLGLLSAEFRRRKTTASEPRGP